MSVVRRLARARARVSPRPPGICAPRFARDGSRCAVVTRPASGATCELVLPSATDDAIVSHPEGNTPLLDRDRVSHWAGVEHWLMKHEGHNPTGSFKDRGMTVAMTQAKRTGARAVACASTGKHVGVARRVRGTRRAPRPRFCSRRSGRARKADADHGLWCEDAPRARQILMSVDTRARGQSRAEHSAAQLDQPVPARGTEVDRAGAPRPARLERADWIALPAGNLGKHVGVR